MRRDLRLVLSYLFVVNHILRIDCRCGHPELPSMAVDIEPRDYFNDGDTLMIKCISGVVVGDNLEPGLIECRNNAWNSSGLRCSQSQSVVSVNISPTDGRKIDVNDSILNEYSHQNLFDGNPLTCTALVSSQKWTIKLKASKFVSNVAIIATSALNHTDKLLTGVLIQLSSGDLCQMEENSNSVNSPIEFTVYKCAHNAVVDSVSVSLPLNHSEVNVCDIQIFAINDAVCGKPEQPLYSTANQSMDANEAKTVEYICESSYHVVGNSVRTCGADGLWSPATPPVCMPDVKCDTELADNETFRLHFEDLDRHGFAVPESTILIYYCVNDSLVMWDTVIRHCQPSGNWSAFSHPPVCRPPIHPIVALGHHLMKNRYILWYGVSGLVLLFVVSFVILYHMRRLAKRISRQMRENAYKLQDKVLPNYNNESNYQDITSVLATNDSNPPPVQPSTPKF